MKYQRFVSLFALLSFIVPSLSSGILYFIPDRKVTAWTEWGFLGLDKQQWDNLHSLGTVDGVNYCHPEYPQNEK